MMGRLETDQGRLCYDFRLEAHVPADHLLRKIDRALDLGWPHEALRPFYRHTGRPSIEPELSQRP